MKPAIALLLGLVAWTQAQAQDPSSPEKKNWFEDPFFQVSAGLPGCAPPNGPLLTFEEQRKEAHWRVERGTSCWLAGKCRDSNAYRYDKTLAGPVNQALRAVPEVSTASVWVTIQRRWVFLQGCVAEPAMTERLRQAAQAVPDVEAVVPMLEVGIVAKPRYEVRKP